MPSAVAENTELIRRLRTTPVHTVRPWPLPRARSPLIESLRESLASAVDPQTRTERISSFTSHLREHGTPLIEPDGDPEWCLVSFIYIGNAPHGVVLQLNRLTDVRDVEDTLLEQIADSPVHALTLRLPSSWQGSYLLAPLPQSIPPNLHDPLDRAELMRLAQAAETDPFAREHMPSKPTLASAKQQLPPYAVARGPAAPCTALWSRSRVEPHTTRTVSSPVSGEPLALHHWATPFSDEHSPVVVLFDGEVWDQQFPVAAEIAERHDAGGFPPAHLVLLESGGPMQRELDYAAPAEQSGQLLEAIAEELTGVIPAAGWVLAGQSFGGLFAALCAHRHPQRVHAALAQSPSFWWPGPVHPWEPRTQSWFEERAAVDYGAPVLLQAGAVDAGVVDRARDAAALLRSRHALIDYQEHPGGHDVLQWQSDIVDGLSHILSLCHGINQG